MDDYIKRDDALDLCVCDLRKPDHKVSYRGVLVDMGLRIGAIPAADVVKVVRCKDCVHRVTDEVTGVWWCIANGGIRDEDFFCRDGKRKEA